MQILRKLRKFNNKLIYDELFNSMKEINPTILGLKEQQTINPMGPFS